MKTSYKNSAISSSTYTDLAGNAGCTYPNAGELELGDTAAFLGHQAYNTDDTQTSMPAEDAVISTGVCCDICGLPVKDKKLLTKQNGYYRCRECIDEE